MLITGSAHFEENRICNAECRRKNVSCFAIVDKHMQILITGIADMLLLGQLISTNRLEKSSILGA